jgi:(p)ppGpp synthase/HD superfamily hydrolase
LLDNQIANILRAARFAASRHHGQPRKWTNEPYIVHPLRVAELVAHVGEPAITVALLHDVLEDTKTTFRELELVFGTVIAQLVDELSDPPREFGNREARKAESARKLKSWMAINVKCCDIADNLLSMAYFDAGAARKFISELNHAVLATADPKCYGYVKNSIRVSEELLLAEHLERKENEKESQSFASI